MNASLRRELLMADPKKGVADLDQSVDRDGCRGDASSVDDRAVLRGEVVHDPRFASAPKLGVIDGHPAIGDRELERSISPEMRVPPDASSDPDGLNLRKRVPRGPDQRPVTFDLQREDFGSPARTTVETFGLGQCFAAVWHGRTHNETVASAHESGTGDGQW